MLAVIGLAGAIPLSILPSHVPSQNSTKPVGPVVVALYYEGLCPYCRRFLGGDLFAATTKLQSIMRLELFPYGNAK